MNSDRIKEIQMTTAYPDSVSVQQALLQVWNECEHEKVKNLSSKPMLADRLPNAEDVKRWYQLLVGIGEDVMRKDIEATLR
jgi:hypothetical protein